MHNYKVTNVTQDDAVKFTSVVPVAVGDTVRLSDNQLYLVGGINHNAAGTDCNDEPESWLVVEPISDKEATEITIRFMKQELDLEESEAEGA
jgi:hypothetical protein